MTEPYSGKTFSVTPAGKIIARIGGSETSNPKVKSQAKKRAAKLRRIIAND